MERKLEALMVGFDFSSNGRRAVETALAMLHKSKAEKKALRIVTSLPARINPAIVDAVENVEKNEDRLMTKVDQLERAEGMVKRVLGDLDFTDIEVHYDIQYHKYPQIVLINADMVNPELVIVGATSRDDEPSRVIGTDTERLVRKSLWPVMVVKPGKPLLPKRVLAAVDYSQASKRALAWAFQMARMGGGELDVVHVVDELHDDETFFAAARPTDNQERLQKAKEELNNYMADLNPRITEGVTFSTRVVVGVPHLTIVEEAKKTNADLVTLGTLGRSGIMEILIGGTSERVIRQVPASILACKPDTFVFKYKPSI